MPMTLAITNSAPGRVRGFLASCMCEIAPGIYTAPRMTKAVRERLWNVLQGWFEHQANPDYSVLLTWPDRNEVGGQQVLTLGMPRTSLHCENGVYLTHRRLLAAEERSLKIQDRLEPPRPPAAPAPPAEARPRPDDDG